MSETMHKAAKYRVDSGKLSPETKTFLMKNFGCARKVYNLYVDFLYAELEKRGFESGFIPSDIKPPEVTAFKTKYAYLKEVDSLALANAKINFERAISKYNEEYDHKSYTKRALRRAKSGTEPLSFRGLKGMPKFHAKAQGYFSYSTNCQYREGQKPTIRLNGDRLHLPKLKEDLPLIMHRPFPQNAKIGTVTVTMDTDGGLYASIGYSYVAETKPLLKETSNSAEIVDKLNILGLDYSQKDFYVDSEGRKANYPHYYRKAEERLAECQRQLSRMQKGSKNYLKKLNQLRKLSLHIAQQRKDFLHKLSRKLVDAYDVIVVEDIDLRAMGEALSLGKNLHDNGFGMFRDMLAYKLKDKGSMLIKIDRMYPSTKMCHDCGAVNPEVTLGISEWDCPSCGVHHDRDYNAALNIRDCGKAQLIGCQQS